MLTDIGKEKRMKNVSKDKNKYNNYSRRTSAWHVIRYFLPLGSLNSLIQSFNHRQVAMGSERLSHAFTAKDPTFKGKSALANPHDPADATSHHAMSHTSGTQPVSLSNGPKSSASTKKITRHKPNSKHRKLLKLYAQQLSHLDTTCDAIESLSTSMSVKQQREFLHVKKHLEEVKIRDEQLRSCPSDDDHESFDQMKNDIDQLIEEFKTFKTSNCHHPDAMTPLDLLVGVPVDASESDDDDPQEPKTLIYF